MSDNADSNRLVNHIGCDFNRTSRQAHYNGEIQCALKKGGRWVASRAALLRELGAA
jgi:hypothetical protein